jgi:hypothetical protein
MAENEVPKLSARERLDEMLKTPIPFAKPKPVVPREEPAEASSRLLARLRREWEARIDDEVRRQHAIDCTWARTLEARREAEEEAAQSCHRGPGDSDYRLR